MLRNSCSTALFLLAGWNLLAQGSESAEPSNGFTFYERFQGSVNTLGAVTRLDSNIGYNFNSHLSLDGGIPVYFVSPSSSTTAATGTQSSNGIGNAYGQIRLTLNNPVVNFGSTVTGTAPTGDKAQGFSTGRVTVDWTNYFERNFSRLTPFANIGIANSVSDTVFFTRPYTTLGFVAHFEGGARYRFAHIVSISASAYAIKPSGQQTVVSRVVHAQQEAAPAPATSVNRRNRGVFETANLTTGAPDIAKDHGFSTWLQLSPASSVDLYAGYTRSTQYSLNTVFFGVGVSVGKVFRRWVSD